MKWSSRQDNTMVERIATFLTIGGFLLGTLVISLGTGYEIKPDLGQEQVEAPSPERKQTRPAGEFGGLLPQGPAPPVPTPEPVRVTKTIAPRSLSDYSWSGTLTRQDDTKTVFLKQAATGHTLACSLGTILEGWILSAIDRDTLTFSQGAFICVLEK